MKLVTTPSGRMPLAVLASDNFSSTKEGRVSGPIIHEGAGSCSCTQKVITVFVTFEPVFNPNHDRFAWWLSQQQLLSRSANGWGSPRAEQAAKNSEALMRAAIGRFRQRKKAAIGYFETCRLL